MEHGSYERGGATIPYALDRVDGARHLLVSFPALTAAEAPPLVEVGRYLEGLRCHRLYVGSDEQFFVGPDGTLAGAHAAVHLIWRESRRLDVPEGQVICIGSSFRALCALYIGLKARAGLIVAGAPPVRAGRWIAKLLRGSAPLGQARDLRIALGRATGVDQTPESQVQLDRLILRAAQRAEHRAQLALFCSRQDEVIEESRWLLERVRGHATIGASLTEGDYGPHDQIKAPFFRFVRGQVRQAITAVRAA